MFTIQKTDTGFTVTKGAGRPQPYFFNDARFVDIDGTNFSLVKCGRGHIIFNQPYTSVINGDTTEAFGSLSDLEAYINSYFFRKPGGEAGLTSQTLTEDVVIDVSDKLLTFQTTIGGKLYTVKFSSDIGFKVKCENPDVSYCELTVESDGLRGDAVDEVTGNHSFFDLDGEGIYMEYRDNESGKNVTIEADPTGAWVRDDINQLGGYYKGDIDFSIGRQNRNWWAAWGAVEDYVDEGFDPGIATLVNGQVTVNSTLVKTISRQITLNYESVNGTLGILAALGADITDGESFIIKSLNPNGTVNTDDNSQIRYCVIGD